MKRIRQSFVKGSYTTYGLLEQEREKEECFKFRLFRQTFWASCMPRFILNRHYPIVVIPHSDASTSVEMFPNTLDMWPSKTKHARGSLIPATENLSIYF